MHDPQNIRWGQQAMARGYINQEQARVCLEEATQQQDSILNVALNKNWINSQQIQEILNLSRIGALQTQMATPSIAPSSQASEATQKTFEAPKIGQRLGAYTLNRILGQGAMGIVYGAEQDGTEYALKLVLQDSDPEALVRFEIEAQALASVDTHPNIVRIHKFERADNHAFFILDLIDGESLDRRLLSGAISDFEYCLSITEKLASALAHIHKNDIIHRDLKSANVLVRAEDGEPFLADFGLVKRMDFATMTKEGESLGTPHTMSPEQIQGLSLDPRSDLWSLGVVLYEMVTGRLPFHSEKLVDLGQQIVEETPENPQSINPDIPDDIESIILACLQKDPDKRYPSAESLRKDCRAYLAGKPLIFAQSKSSLSMVGRLLKSLLLVCVLLLPFGIYFYLELKNESQWTRTAQLNLVEIDKITAEVEPQQTELFGVYLFQVTNLDLPSSINTAANKQRSVELIQLLTTFDSQMNAANNLGLESSKTKLLNSESHRKSIKLAVCWRALEETRESKGAKFSEEKKQAIPKSFRPIVLGYQSLILNELDQARTYFDKAKSKDSKIAQLGTLGTAIIDFQLKNWNAARYNCKNLIEKNSKLSVFALELREIATKREFLLVLEAKKSRPNLVLKSARTWREQSKIQDEGQFWLNFKSELQARFNGENKTELDRLQLLVVHKNMKALKKQWPVVPIPNLDKKTHLSAAAQALRLKDRAQAYYHYLQARTLDPSFELPQGFRVEDIPKVMTQAFAERDAKKSLILWFNMVLAASRSGLFVPVISDEWIIQLFREGVLDRELGENPDDPAARYWRGLAWTCAKADFDPKKAQAFLKQCVDDLTYAIDSGKMSATFVARALTERVNCRNRMDNFAETISKSLSDLKRAAKLPHPCPDQVFSLLFDLQMSQLGFDESLALLRKADLAVLDRLKRTQDNELNRGRPKDSPMLLLNEVDRANTMAANHRRRGELYIFHRNYKEAEREVLTSLKLKRTDYALSTLGRVYLFQNRIAAAEAILTKHPPTPGRPHLLQLAQNIAEVKKARKRQ